MATNAHGYRPERSSGAGITHNTMKTEPFTADNITPKAIDLISFVLKSSAKQAEELWEKAQYGRITPAEGAKELNELIRRIQLTFQP